MPTEAEWEHAARGGLDGNRFARGDEAQIDGKSMANIWQGTFPVTDAGEDGCKGMAAVASFPPNRYGLYDMAGNVWQFAASGTGLNSIHRQAMQGPVSDNPAGPPDSFDPDEPFAPKRVIHGSSFLW